MSKFQMTKLLGDLFKITCEHINSFKDVLNQLKNEDFDLAITEVFDPCSLGFNLIYFVSQLNFFLIFHASKFILIQNYAHAK